MTLMSWTRKKDKYVFYKKFFKKIKKSPMTIKKVL